MSSQGQPPGEALALIQDLEGQPGLMRHFMTPLAMGAPVTIGVPLGRDHLDEAEAAVMTGDRAVGELELALQKLSTRLVAHPVPLELTVEEIRLGAVAYQICWFFHWAPEQGRIWERRLENIVQECDALLTKVGLPRTEGQLLARHLLLRHLPSLYRVDTRAEFGSFLWGSLDFVGTEPHWVKLPGRSRAVFERRAVWVHRRVYQKPVARTFWRLLSLSPLTSLLWCDRLHPYFTFWGTAAALALPDLCRLVTNAYIDGGLGRYAPALARGFLDFLADTQQPLSHKRYIGRFLYNLALTWCTVNPEARLGVALEGPDGALPAGGDIPRPADGQEPGEALETGDFYAVIEALHRLRGPLGGAHLMADEGLAARLSLFLESSPAAPRRSGEVTHAVGVGLQYV